MNTLDLRMMKWGDFGFMASRDRFSHLTTQLNAAAVVCVAHAETVYVAIRVLFCKRADSSFHSLSLLINSVEF